MTTADAPDEGADDVLAGGTPAEARDARLHDGAESLAGRGPGSWIVPPERFLVAAAGTLMSAGVVAIALAWLGASRSVLVTEQVPYLISGGLLGVALATIGAVAYFAHWIAALLRDSRRQHDELVAVIREERARDRDDVIEAIRELRDQETDDGRARSTGARRQARRAPRTS